MIFETYSGDELTSTIKIADYENPVVNDFLEEGLQRYNKDRLIGAKRDGNVIVIKTKGFYVKVEDYVYEVWDITLMGIAIMFTGPKGSVSFWTNDIKKIDLEPM